MPAPSLRPLALLAAGCLAGHLGQAQQAPLAPLVLRRAQLRLPAPTTAPTRLYNYRVYSSFAPHAGSRFRLSRQQVAEMVAAQPLQPSRPQALILLDSRLIISENILASLSPDDLVKTTVIKRSDATSQWGSAGEHGILDLTLKPHLHFRSKSQARLRRQLHLAGPVRFELDGLPLADIPWCIAKKAIAGLDVTPPAPGTAGPTVVNIRLARRKPPKIKPTIYDPTVPPIIRIRGVASR